MTRCGHPFTNVTGVDKLKTRLYFLTGLMAAFMLVSGCSSTGDVQDEGAAGAQVEDRDGAAETTGMSGGGAWTGSALENPDSPLYTKVIYFDFDVSTIRSEYVDTLRAHADYLINNPSAMVTIEGHCDERGSREYNIGLGEQRANAVQQFFETEGVSASQINTISYGEERPEDPGHSEAAWAMNRRAVLSY